MSSSVVLLSMRERMSGANRGKVKLSAKPSNSAFRVRLRAQARANAGPSRLRRQGMLAEPEGPAVVSPARPLT